jgi:hypothetical protein
VLGEADLAGDDLGGVDVEGDAPAAFDALAAAQPVADLDLQGQLLADFADEGRARLFPGLELAAGELPLERRRHLGAALGHETGPAL